MDLLRNVPWRIKCIAFYGFAGINLIATSPASAKADVPFALNQPAILTPRVQTGLFTSIARAGARLVAVGERGRIVLSDDNGVSWRQVETPTSVTLTAVRFADVDQGWAVGQMGIVLHTDDGGLTWIKQLDGIQAGNIMLAAAKADVAVRGTEGPTAANLQAAQQIVSGGPNVPFLAILPLSPRHLLIAGAFGLAFSSEDGGITWQSIAGQVPNPDGLHIYGLARSGGIIFAVGEQGLVLKQTATGQVSMVTTPAQGTLLGVLVSLQQTILVFGLQGAIFRSDNGGAAWLAPKSNDSTGIDCGVVLANGNIILGDIAGKLLFSRNDGNSFNVYVAGEPVAGVAQAADGAVIVAGPLGLRRISLKSPGTGL